MFEKIKRFFIKYIFGSIYDSTEILEKRIPVSKMNRAETDLLIDTLYTDIYTMQQDIKIIIEYIGEAATQCDKCFNYSGDEVLCFKCENSGVVRNKQLCDWPWEN